MQVPRFGAQHTVGMNMTPMIDVVFLLIVFFLVSSHLARREHELQLELPSAATGEEEQAATTPRLTLNVLPDGRLSLAGVTVRADQLSGRFVTALRREGEDLEVRIRADRQVAYRDVAPVLTAAAHSGIWNVTFAVIRQDVP